MQLASMMMLSAGLIDVRTITIKAVREITVELRTLNLLHAVAVAAQKGIDPSERARKEALRHCTPAQTT